MKKKMCKKSLLLIIFLLPMVSFSGWFGWGNNIDLDDLEIEELPKIVIPGEHGPQKGKVKFTRVGKELYQAFLEQKNYDMTKVNNIMEKNAGSKYYHLYSAYCYGFQQWKNTKDLYDQEKIKRVVWNIAQEFASQQKPTWKDKFLNFSPHAIWASITIVAFVAGMYLQENEDK